MKISINLSNIPSVQELKQYFLSRNGVPLKKRDWFHDPLEYPVVRDVACWYEYTKQIAYQAAIEKYPREQHFPWVTLQVFADHYPPLYDTYHPGLVRFFGHKSSGLDWSSKVYENPTYGDLINVACECAGTENLISCERQLLVDDNPDYVNFQQPDKDGAVGIYLPM